MHSVFVPPAIMITQPVAWLHAISKQKGATYSIFGRLILHNFVITASCVIGSSRVLSGCIALVGHKDLKDVTLDSVRFFLLSDGANPCELFYHIHLIYHVELKLTTRIFRCSSYSFLNNKFDILIACYEVDA